MKWLVDLAIAAAAALAADTVTKKVTGRHIHEHILEWWGGIRDRILAWAHSNQHLRIVQVVVWLDTNVASRLARLTTTARTQHGQVYVVTEETVDREEACELFPELRSHPGVDITQVLHQ